MAEDKYVLRHEWERSRGKVHERINEVDNKHVNLHNDLKLMVTTNINSTDMLLKSNDKTNNILEKIDDKLDGYNERIINVENGINNTKNRLKSIETTVTERQKGNVQIWVAIIGLIGTITVGALGLAQLFL